MTPTWLRRRNSLPSANPHAVLHRSCRHGRLRRRATLQSEQLESRALLAADLVISELVAIGSTFRDADGDPSDWIEIHNPTDEPVDLLGWSLTDDANDLGKWKFPLIHLAPGDYQIVYSSGKDRAVDDFRLTRDFHATEDGTFLVDLDEGTYDVRLTMGDADRARDEVVVAIQNELVDVVATAAGEFAVRTYRAEVRAADGGQLAITLQDTGGQTSLAAINALAILPVDGGAPRWFDFGAAHTPVEPGFTPVMETDTYNTAAGYGWQVDDVVRAQDRGTERNDLHTNFKLRAAGDYLALVEPDGSTVAFAYAPQYPPQRQSTSYGLEQGAIEAAAARFFTTPTPGAPNGDLSFSGLAAPPTTSAAGGLFDVPFDVVIATDAPGATLVVTTDTSRPTLDGGTQAVAPDAETPPPPLTIQVSATTVLRAAVFKEGFVPSPVVNRTYIFPADVASQDYQATLDAGFPALWGTVTPDYGLDPDVVGPNDIFGGEFAEQFVAALTAIPTLSVVMDYDDLFGPSGIYTNATEDGFDWERPTSIEWLDPAGGSGFQVDAGIRIYGGFTRLHGNTRKKSLRLVFRERYGPAQLHYPLFGQDAADRFDTIILRNNSNDGWQWIEAGDQPQYIRDEWLRATQLAMRQPSGHGTFTHVYINGIYWGLYNAVERPDASFSSTYFGGDKNEWDGLNAGDPVDGTRDTWLDLTDKAKSVDTPDQQASNAAYQLLLGNHPDGTDDPDLETLLDAGNMIDYLIANIYAGNTDWPTRNFYVARRRGPESTGFKFYAWDSEWTLNMRSPVTIDQTGVNGGVAWVFDKLRDNDEFRLQFADHVHKHLFNGGALCVDPERPNWDPAHPERNVPAARYNELAELVELPLIAESARWGDQHRTELPYTLHEWRAERDFILETYFPQRWAIVLEQLIAAGLYPNVAAPTFNQHGGEVVAGFELVMTGPGEIYYTLDGSDPRRDSFGGAPGISDRAVRYSDPLRLGEGAVVEARALVNGEWSALNEAHFTVGAPPLRITEVMYHPRGAGAGSPYADDNDFEFIELVNTSAMAAIDLQDVAFTQGMEFAFPPMTLAPGQHVVVVRNREAFASRYGTGILVAGQYGGTAADFKLDNGGEWIQLVDASGTVIQEFVYNDAWHRNTDGGGFSLEALDPARVDLDHFNRADAWLPSIELGGTPGAARASATVAAGDVNLDGQVNLDDVDLFALGLASPAAYAARFGVPATLAGDVDGDGDLDFDDIDDFLSRLGAERPGLTLPAYPSAQQSDATCVRTIAMVGRTSPRRSTSTAVSAQARADRPALLPGRGTVAPVPFRPSRAPHRRGQHRIVALAEWASRSMVPDTRWAAVTDRTLETSSDWLKLGTHGAVDHPPAGSPDKVPA